MTRTLCTCGGFLDGDENRCPECGVITHERCSSERKCEGCRGGWLCLGCAADLTDIRSDGKLDFRLCREHCEEFLKEESNAA